MQRIRLFLGAVLAAVVAGGLIVVPAGPAMAAPPIGVWVNIKPRHVSNKCLDVVGGSTTVGARIQQWTCLGNTQQQFKIISSSLGKYVIQARHSGFCLDLVGGATADGTPFQQSFCDSRWTELYGFTLISDGSYQIIGHQSKCADITGASTADGARLQYWTCFGSLPANQRFTITAV